MIRLLSLRSSTVMTALVLLLATSCSSGVSSSTAPSNSDQSLVLVMYGDSLLYTPGDQGAIDVYVEMLEEDLGISVDVRMAMADYGYPPHVVSNLASERAQSELAGADVVIIESPVDAMAIAVLTAAGLEGLDPAACGGTDNQQCLRDSLAEYKNDVEEIFLLLTKAADPSETLIRAVDVYAIVVTDQLAAGMLHVTNPYWQEAQEFFADTAAKYGIPTARVFDEFMRPDGTHDPNDRGLIGPDKLHPSEAGALLIAELIHDLGYDFAG